MKLKNPFFLFLIDLFLGTLFCVFVLIEKISKRPTPSNPKKILVLELWGIGDLVMMSPILEPIRSNFSNAEIVLLSKKEGKILFEGAGAINRFIEFDFPWARFSNKYHFWKWPWRRLFSLVRDLRNEKFDLILDGRDDVRNNLISFLIGAKRRIGFSDTGGSYFLTDSLKRSMYKHRTDRWLEILSVLKVPTYQKNPKVFVRSDEREFIDTYLKKAGIDRNDYLIGIHPGAGAAVRRWPLDRFVRLSNDLWKKLNVRIIMLADPESYGNDPSLDSNILKFQGSLGSLIALIERLSLLVCNDSGPMHIAAALKVPIFAIFGPGNPKQIGPVGECVKIAIQEPMACRPCFDQCIYSEPYCLTKLETPFILNEVENFLKQLEILTKAATS